MIYDTSYFDRNIKEEINDLVGSPFGLLERLKMKGIGGARMKISQVSPDIYKLLPTGQADVFTSVELRPKGVIFHLKKYTEHFSWVIPYHRLTIYQSKRLSIYEGNTFMKFNLSDLNSTHESFIRKLMNSRLAYLERYSLTPA